MEIRVGGVDELVRALEAHGADVHAALEAILNAGADVVEGALEGNEYGFPIERELVRLDDHGGAMKVGPEKEAAWYAHFIEGGTDPHEIEAQTRQALAFDGHVVAKVNHPGTAARPFVRPAFDESEGDAQRAMGGALAEQIP